MRKQVKRINRRRGYAEVECMAIERRQKKEKAYKWTFNAVAVAIFSGLILWVTIELIMFFNGTIGG